jgi:hypothetical protein
MQIRRSKNPGHEPSPTDAEDGKAGSHEQESDLEDTSSLPNITKMPEGYEVVEQRVGRAVGQWVLMVRCQCGRRWFEVERIDAATCPRCGLLVYVDIPARSK